MQPHSLCAVSPFLIRRRKTWPSGKHCLRSGTQPPFAARRPQQHEYSVPLPWHPGRTPQVERKLPPEKSVAQQTGARSPQVPGAGRDALRVHGCQQPNRRCCDCHSLCRRCPCSRRCSAVSGLNGSGETALSDDDDRLAERHPTQGRTTHPHDNVGRSVSRTGIEECSGQHHGRPSQLGVDLVRQQFQPGSQCTRPQRSRNATADQRLVSGRHQVSEQALGLHPLAESADSHQRDVAVVDAERLERAVLRQLQERSDARRPAEGSAPAADSPSPLPGPGAPASRR